MSTTADADVAIRLAGVADAERVTDITVRNFTETFGHLYPPEDLAHFLASNYTVDKHRQLLADPAHALWLVEEQGEAIGHLLAGPCKLPHTDVVDGDGEIQRCYLLAKAHNRGIGAQLMDTAMAWLLQSGPRGLWVGVWSENYGAQRFYARYGFEKAGEYLFPVGETRDREFILRRHVQA